MKKSFYPLMKLISTAVISIPFIVCWFVYYEPRTMTTGSRQSSVLLLLCYISLLYMLCTRLDGYRITLHRIREVIFSQILAVGATDALAAILIWMLSIHFPNLWPGVLCYLIQAMLTVPNVVLTHKWCFAGYKPSKSIVVYDVRQGMEELIHTYGLEKRFDVQETCPIEEILEHLERLEEYETVFMCGIHSHDRNIVLKSCIETGKSVYLIPRVGDVIMSGAEHMHMLHLPVLKVSRYAPSTEFRIAKRVFDVGLSSISLILLSPLLAVISLAVRKDGGPAFYKQARLTKDGKVFQIIKFRSMRVDAEKQTGAVLSAGDNDPRITRIGRILRAYRLDELPQLINILKGEMSFVGPRPERPEIAAEYEKEMPEFKLRLQAKAGLTGYAQVFGKYNTTPYDKLLMDLMYIAQPSLLEEVLIILSTVKILFVKESTEGIQAGTSNAQDNNYWPNRRNE